MSKRYSVCQRCGRPIVGVATRAPFITLRNATLWRHVGTIRRYASHQPVVPKEDR